MKKLSDYTGEAAIELWADLLDPLTSIFGDEKVQKAVIGNGSMMSKAQIILSEHKAEAVAIMQRIDPTPINGLNIITRLVGLISEIEKSEEFAGFFDSPSQETTERGSSGSVTESTEAAAK